MNQTAKFILIFVKASAKMAFTVKLETALRSYYIVGGMHVLNVPLYEISSLARYTEQGAPPQESSAPEPQVPCGE